MSEKFYALSVNAGEFAEGIKTASVFLSKKCELGTPDELQYLCLAQHKPSQVLSIIATDAKDLYRKRIKLDGDSWQNLPMTQTVDGLADYGFLYIHPTNVKQLISMLPNKPVGAVVFTIKEEWEDKKLYYNVEVEIFGNTTKFQFRTEQLNYPDMRRLFAYFDELPEAINPDRLHLAPRCFARIAKAFANTERVKLEVTKDEMLFKFEDAERSVAVLTTAMRPEEWVE